MKREHKQLKLEHADMTRRADEAEKYAHEKDKVTSEMSSLQLKIAKGTSENEILKARGDLQTEQAKMQELRLREIELQSEIEKRKIGNENVLIETEQNSSITNHSTSANAILCQLCKRASNTHNFISGEITTRGRSTTPGIYFGTKT
jgi:hypothetical protein